MPVSLSAEEKPYICSLCDFIAPDSSAFISHLRAEHPEPSLGQEPSAPKSTSASTSSTTTGTTHHPSSSRAGGGSSGGASYPKLKRALLQGAPHSHSPSPSRSPSEHPLAPNTVVATHARPLTPAPADCEPAVDLCVRPEGARGAAAPSPSACAAAGDLPPEGLPSHCCSYCAHRTRYPEVLWMHQMIAHRLNSSALVPKWAQKSNGSGSRKSSELRRRTGPPPALGGKEGPPLPINVRSARTRPPASSAAAAAHNSNNHLKRDRPSSSSSSSSSSVSSSSSSAQPRPGSSAPRNKVPRVSHTSTSRQQGEPDRKQQQQQQEPPASRSRPRVDLYPRVASAGALEKNAGAPHSSGNSGSGGGGGGGGSSSTTSPRPGARMADRYLLPQEGLGYMLSSKHGFSEYGRPKGVPSTPPQAPKAKPKPSVHSQTAHTAITTTAAMANHLYGASHPHGGAALLGLGSPALLRSGEAKQETMAAGTPDTQLDILSFLKNCNSHELATLYHRWGMTNPLLEHTGEDTDMMQ